MVSEPNSVTMIETRSIVALADRSNSISKAADQCEAQYEAGFHVLHQKLDAITIVLQTLSKTV